jgi:GNAT superfamily N-acetyltransferase
MGIEIRQVDPDDEHAVRDFYDIYVTCGRQATGFIAWPYQQLASAIREPTEDFAYTGFLAYDGAEAVGEGWYAAYLRTNLDQALTTPRVLPQHRRRGIGGAVLARLAEFALGNGRTTTATHTFWPVEYGPEGAGAPNVEFARKHGYPLVLVDAGRLLRLPVAGEILDELSAKADPAYVIRVFAGPVPEELIQGWAELDASLPTEAPTGDRETDEAPPSVDAVRQRERRLLESGQNQYNAVALAPDGELVGYTAITAGSADAPAGQWGTLVRRGHRGRGLGYGLKTAVIRLLQQERPEITATITSNALTNTAMVAVNNRLGYEVVDYVGTVQKHATADN